MKILVTGFEPFGEHKLNPSQMVLEKLNQEKFNDIEVLTTLLPVDQQNAPTTLINSLRTHHPDGILSFGLASGRVKICLERVAINLMDFRIPDNAGKTVIDQPVVADGPAAYFSSLPVRHMMDCLQKEGIPVQLSLSAGAYLCNQVFYRMMHEIAINNLPIQAGFIHLPALPQQAANQKTDIPSLCLSEDLQAARLLIQILSEKELDKPFNP